MIFGNHNFPKLGIIDFLCEGDGRLYRGSCRLSSDETDFDVMLRSKSIENFLSRNIISNQHGGCDE